MTNFTLGKREVALRSNPMSARSSDTRSPLKRSPLRAPGQWLDERERQLLDKWTEGYGLAAVSISFLAFMEWIGVWTDRPRMPWLFTLAAVAAIALAARRLRRTREQRRRLKLGSDGEKVVAELLEPLRAHGAEVIHDIPADWGNLDHVVISPRGILVVETKTLSKPGGSPTVVYDGACVTINGSHPSRDPIAQVNRSVQWLGRLLESPTGREFPIRGVVVYPGWFVDNSAARGSDTWVLEPKALGKWIANEPVRLSAEEVRLAASLVKQHVLRETA
ncbi:MAG: NERD domain-containing protein [Steroidobacteraceae bacterium]|nr:NERD domain-containing protein [Steroidobacteraceae bacterium]